MLRKIDPKHIENAVKHNGKVTFKAGKVENGSIVIEETSALKVKSMGQVAPSVLSDQYEQTPYTKICSLDETVYGKGLFVAGDGSNAKWDLLTDKGVIIGSFDMKGKGFYNADMNGLLPKEASESMDRNQSCEPVSLNEIVAGYCAKNPESIEFIPEETYKKFPELAKDLVSEIEKEEAKLDTPAVSVEKPTGRQL